jgi:hypothetical protein
MFTFVVIGSNGETFILIKGSMIHFFSSLIIKWLNIVYIPFQYSWIQISISSHDYVR